MKKYFWVFVAIAIVSSSVQGKYSGGSGTTDDPYKIGTAADLLALAADTNDYDANFILIADINLAGYDFNTAVIAPYTIDTNGYLHGVPFTGVFDGACHKITNLTISYGGGTDYNSYLGLFGYIEGPIPDYPDLNCKDVVKNLTIENVNITGRSNSKASIMGGLAGYNIYGGVNNCVSTGYITGQPNGTELGGLIGLNEYGSINNCSSTVDVNASGWSIGNLGGLVGANSYGTISNCFATGSVSGRSEGTGSYSHAFGGLVGYNSGTISCCWASGNITNSAGVFGTGYCYGGLVGENDGLGVISNCYATGDVNSIYWDIGGLVGQNGGIIINCYATGDSSGYNDIGGLVGTNTIGATITNCYSIGAATGEDSFGGLVGKNGGAVTTSFWDVDTSGLTISDGGTGEATTEMKKESTFTVAGWDFVGETINGTEDIWWILEHITYPKLNWQRKLPSGGCGGGGPGSGDGGIYFPDYNFDNFIDFFDFAIFANAWLTENPFISLDGDNYVDINDLKIFCDYWLKYTNNIGY